MHHCVVCGTYADDVYDGEWYCERCLRATRHAVERLSPVSRDMLALEARQREARRMKRRLRWGLRLFVLLEVPISCVIALSTLPGPWVYLVWLIFVPCAVALVAAGVYVANQLLDGEM